VQRVNRTDLQALADLRVREAAVLLDAGLFAGAYYLVGYSLECAFKSLIAKQIREHDFPDKKLLTESYTHELQRLLNVSGLKTELEAESSKDPNFETNWAVAKDWSEQARYDPNVAENKARDLFAAVTDTDHGVLPWLKRFW
jgi:hypothetical protein